MVPRHDVPLFIFSYSALLFAADGALVVHTSEDLQALLDRFAAARTTFRLKISEKNTVADQPATEEPENKHEWQEAGRCGAILPPQSYITRNVNMEAEYRGQNPDAVSLKKAVLGRRSSGSQYRCLNHLILLVAKIVCVLSHPH